MLLLLLQGRSVREVLLSSAGAKDQVTGYVGLGLVALTKCSSTERVEMWRRKKRRRRISDMAYPT